MLLNCLEQMSSIYESMDSIIITNREGVVEYAALIDKNGNSINNAGYTGKHLLDIYKDLTEEKSTIFRVMKTGIPIVNEIQTLVDFNGRKLKLSCCTYPITFGNKIIGAIDGVIYLGDDGLPVNNQIRRHQSLKTKKGDYYDIDDFITKDPEMIKEKEKIIRIAEGESPVMIYGETGTGKEIIAQAIHTLSGRRGDFVSQNCSAIPISLLESTLFGTVKGSYTGSENRKGLLELANGGTLFLDELNSMDIELQGKLLRAVENQKIRRVGDEKERDLDVRIVSALNRRPKQAIEKGEIREDLYYRLGVLQINLTPLRDRRDDISLLISHYISEYNVNSQKNIKGCSELAYNFMMQYNWPGNVRELRNAIEYAFNVSKGEYITVDDLPDYIVSESRRENSRGTDVFECAAHGSIIENKPLKEAVEEYEKRLIQSVYRDLDNMSLAARQLGISRQSLRYKLKKHGIL